MINSGVALKIILPSLHSTSYLELDVPVRKNVNWKKNNVIKLINFFTQFTVTT